MADNPDRLAQIMQRMQVSNQRSVGNRLGGANGANAPTPPSEQIDFTKNTLSPPSMAQPDDTGPGQQMPSVIQPPASSPVGMPSGGNAYSGSQPGVSPSTRDLYSLPDYSGGMGGGNSGGGFDVGRLLKMLSSYMGSQNGGGADLVAGGGWIGVPEGVTPGTYTPHEYTGDPSLLASNTPSLSSLDGRSPQGMPSIPATMGNEYKSRMMERDNSLNKFNALSEQEKASVLKNLRISTS